MYQKEEYDYLFYQMKKTIPNHSILFLIITIIKLYPFFFLVHSGGYLSSPNSLSTFHRYFSYFSVTYYLKNSLSAQTIIIISAAITIMNILLIVIMVYYIMQAKKTKKANEEVSYDLSTGHLFSMFSNAVFFKYIILFQFFIEINALPLICLPNAIDSNKLTTNAIYANVPLFLNKVNTLCTGSNLYIFSGLSALNIIIDVLYYGLITSRFFDFNILSNYKWNFYPSLFFSFEFMESAVQIFFILFLDYNTKTYKIALNSYIALIFIVNIFHHWNQSTFCTADTYTYVSISEFIRLMCYIAAIFISIFQFGFDAVPNDVNIVGLIIFEAIFVYMLLNAVHSKKKALIKNLLVSNLSELTEKNIYVTLIFLIKEFKYFSDVSCKFSDKNLDLFLENYVNHIKVCEDSFCPCKNYVKKINGAANTIKSGYTTVINFTHIKKTQQEEYILNKFFNVLAANISTTIKHTNNININNMKDNQRQKLIYQLRIKLITAVKKLISYKLEKLTKELDGSLANHFSLKAKDFIRINFYSMNIICNKAYYKTQFLYYEYLAAYFKRNGIGYQLSHIYYLYLKMFSVKEYNEHLTISKQRQKHSHLKMDYRTVLSLCVKFYEIESRLIRTALSYATFIQYFSKDQITFNNILKLIKALKHKYHDLTEYINHYFKSDKINNLFVCTKIILFYKVVHFDIPESLHNKLIIQIHENNSDSTKSHSNIEQTYYIILNYTHGEFIIKFISHELLIVLEYTEDELRDNVYDILLPPKMRKGHKNMIIGEIKSPSIANSNKEVFLVSKSNVCILVDMQYKFLLNMKGEITLMTVLSVKKPTKEFRVAFACINDHGEVLALNREFEDYLILSMKMLDYVKIDTEKVILQNNGQRMRNYFKDEENTIFQENFDYELYLASLFDEEYDGFKEKDEKEYDKKHARWEVLKEMNRKGRYYTRYIELNIKQRVMGREVLYFIKYNVKLTISLKSLEPHNTTLSLIHAVKISKREMAKLSFYRGEDLFECKTEKSNNEDQANDNHDDIFESQSQISSAVTQLKDRNSVRLFHQKGNSFKVVSKGRNLFNLILLIGLFGIISIIYNLVILKVKESMHHSLHNYFQLQFNALVFKKNIYTLSSALLSLSLYEEKITNSSQVALLGYYDPIDNLYDVIVKESQLMNEVSYNFSVLNSYFFSKEIDSLLSKLSTLKYIFNNGIIYSKTNVTILEELISINKLSRDLVNDYDNNISNDNDDVFRKYYFMNRIDSYQNTIAESGKVFNSKAMTVYFIMKNLFEELDHYMESLIVIYKEEFLSQRKGKLINVLIIKLVEFALICLVIIIEWLYVFYGYEQAKKKMVSLRHRIEKNNIEMTLGKISQFMCFSNKFDISALYYIADLDLKRIDESGKTAELSSSKAYGSTISNGSDSRRKKEDNKSRSNKHLSSNLIDIHNISMRDDRELSLRNTPVIKYQSNEKPSSNSPDSKDGKKNLMKVINKLDQIKGIKLAKEINDKNNNDELSNKSKKGVSMTNRDSLNNSHSDSNNNNDSSCIEHSNMKMYNQDKEVMFKRTEDDNNNKPIKSMLKNTSGNNNNNNNSQTNSKIRFDDDHNKNGGNDDQKIKQQQNEEGACLVKKGTRTTKVQFREKNVRYYSPAQNVNEANEGIANPNNKLNKDNRESTIEDPSSQNDNDNDESSEPNPHNKKHTALLNVIHDNHGLTKHSSLNSNHQKSKESSKDFKTHPSLLDSNNGQYYNKFNLLDQGRAITVKKHIEPNEKNLPKKEEIQSKIEKVIHSNYYAAIILHLSLLLFIGLYVASMFLNYDYHSQMGKAAEYATLIVNKTSLYRMLILDYQIHLIEGKYDSSMSNLVLKMEENKKELVDYESSKSASVLPTVLAFEEAYKGNDSCKIFALDYIREYNSTEKEEYICLKIGGEINIHGFKNSEIYLLSIINILIDDWYNKINENKGIDEDLIIEKLTSIDLSNIISEMDGIMRKNQLLLIKYIKRDVDSIVVNIIRNETIIGYLSIGLNFIFLALSMLLIVFPMKFVEVLITWLIKKIIKH